MEYNTCIILDTFLLNYSTDKLYTYFRPLFKNSITNFNYKWIKISSSHLIIILLEISNYEI